MRGGVGAEMWRISLLLLRLVVIIKWLLILLLVKWLAGPFSKVERSGICIIGEEKGVAVADLFVGFFLMAKGIGGVTFAADTEGAFALAAALAAAAAALVTENGGLFEEGDLDLGRDDFESSFFFLGDGTADGRC